MIFRANADSFTASNNPCDLSINSPSELLLYIVSLTCLLKQKLFFQPGSSAREFTLTALDFGHWSSKYLLCQEHGIHGYQVSPRD